MQVCGTKLVKPNVLDKHSWSGDKVQKLARQGDVYIRPTYEFSTQQLEEAARSKVQQEWLTVA